MALDIGNFFSGLTQGLANGVKLRQQKGLFDVQKKLLKLKAQAAEQELEQKKLLGEFLGGGSPGGTPTTGGVSPLDVSTDPNALAPFQGGGVADTLASKAIPSGGPQTQTPSSAFDINPPQQPQAPAGGVLDKLANASLGQLFAMTGDITKAAALKKAVTGLQAGRQKTKSVQDFLGGELSSQFTAGSIAAARAAGDPKLLKPIEVGSRIPLGGGRLALLDKQGNQIGTFQGGAKRQIVELSDPYNPGSAIKVDVGAYRSAAGQVLGRSPGKTPSESNVNQAASAVNLSSEVGELSSLVKKKPELFGRVNALWETAKLKFGTSLPDFVSNALRDNLGIETKGNPEAARAYSLIGGIFNLIAKLDSGKVLTKTELARLNETLPSKYDNIPELEGKLPLLQKRLLELVKTKQDVMRRSGISLGDLTALFGQEKAQQLVGQGAVSRFDARLPSNPAQAIRAPRVIKFSELPQ